MSCVSFDTQQKKSQNADVQSDVSLLHLSIYSVYISRKVRKCIFVHPHSGKIQIGLLVCTDWSESSLGAFWIAKDAKFLHADNKGFDQTADAQADLRLHLPHKSEVTITKTRLFKYIENFTTQKTKIFR